jgi:hypothetical protein
MKMRKKYKLISLSLLCLWGVNAGELYTPVHGLSVQTCARGGKQENLDSLTPVHGLFVKQTYAGGGKQGNSDSSKNQKATSSAVSSQENKNLKTGCMVNSLYTEYERQLEAFLKKLPQPEQNSLVREILNIEEELAQKLDNPKGREDLGQIILSTFLSLAEKNQIRAKKEAQINELEKKKAQLEAAEAAIKNFLEYDKDDQCQLQVRQKLGEINNEIKAMKQELASNEQFPQLINLLPLQPVARLPLQPVAQPAQLGARLPLQPVAQPVEQRRVILEEPGTGEQKRVILEEPKLIEPVQSVKKPKKKKGSLEKGKRRKVSFSDD